MIKHWNTESEQTVYDAHIFQVRKSRRKAESQAGSEIAEVNTAPFYDFHIIKSLDWVHVIPILKNNTQDPRVPENQDQIILVKQFRHGINAPTLEFPGGILDSGEDPQTAAVRELTEETGYAIKSISHFATYHPNPALFNNQCHSFVAEVMPNPGSLSLDETESVEVVNVGIRDLIRNPFGYGFSNAVLLASLFMYANSLKQAL